MDHSKIQKQLDAIQKRQLALDQVLGEIFRTPVCNCRAEAERDAMECALQRDVEAWIPISRPPSNDGFYLVHRDLDNDANSRVYPLYYDLKLAADQRADPSLANDFGSGLPPELRRITHWRSLPPEPNGVARPGS